jgi:hypothetical protein
MAQELVDPRRDDLARQRLEALVERVSDAELAQPLGAGWTVASVLAHLAFWDRRATILLEKWHRGGAPSSADIVDIDTINDAARPQWVLLPPRRAAEDAVVCADAADRAVRAATPELLQQIAAAGGPLHTIRALHRTEHLDEIERILGGAARAEESPMQ